MSELSLVQNRKASNPYKKAIIVKMSSSGRSECNRKPGKPTVSAKSCCKTVGVNINKHIYIACNGMGSWNSDKVITWKTSVSYFRGYSGTDRDTLRKNTPTAVMRRYSSRNMKCLDILLYNIDLRSYLGFDTSKKLKENGDEQDTAY